MGDNSRTTEINIGIILGRCALKEIRVQSKERLDFVMHNLEFQTDQAYRNLVIVLLGEELPSEPRAATVTSHNHTATRDTAIIKLHCHRTISAGLKAICRFGPLRSRICCQNSVVWERVSGRKRWSVPEYQGR